MVTVIVTEMSKSEFAELICVSPAQISQYLADGTIGAEAILGQGRRARIRVDLALAMLSTRLPRSPGADLVDALMRVRSLQAELDHLHTDEHALHARNVKNLLLAIVKGLRGHAD